MQRVSSNFTIFLKIFIPTAWITFFGLFTIAVWFAEDANLPADGFLFRIGFTAFYIFFLIIMYFSVIQLKRVEFGEDGIYVTNYFKTYRYNYSDIANIHENNIVIATLGTIKLKEKGKFGRKISFIISRVNYEDFVQKHTHLFRHILEEDGD